MCADTERPSGQNSSASQSWEKLPDEDLLNIRVRDLGLKIEGTPLEKRIALLYRELDEVDIPLHPECYLADEWACPEGVPAIGVPFYLVNSRLRRLESKYIMDIEGGTHGECMRILRHEAGHAINYAYLLHRKKRWRELFGSFDAEYKDVYRIRPFSRKFVKNLENWYAQMHPDEDFAETFAVWLETKQEWRTKYAGWGALKKLEYVDELVRKEIVAHPPKVIVRRRDLISSADRMRTTLRGYYKKKREQHARSYPDFYDSDLKILFAEGGSPQTEPASQFLKRKHQRLLDSIARWSREKRFTIDGLLRELIERCDELNLHVSRPESDTILEVSTYLTVLIENYKHTGEFKEHR